jgi:hypothetical protein
MLASALLGSGCGSDRKRTAIEADPLASVTGFCQEWGKRACSAPVVEACLATDATACANQQALFCVSLLPPGYASDNAKACLDAVGAAYSNATLTAKEYDTVINLGPPCDKLIEGPGVAGSPCRATSECNTLDNLVCVSKPGAEGSCQVPVIQGGGRSCVEAFHQCAPGFYCNGSNCIEGPAEGQPCSAQVPCVRQRHLLAQRHLRRVRARDPSGRRRPVVREPSPAVNASIGGERCKVPSFSIARASSVRLVWR